MAPQIRWFTAVILLACAGLAAACGGSSSASANPSPSPSRTVTFSPTIPPSTPTAQPAGTGPIVFLAQTSRGVAAHTVDPAQPELAATVADGGFPLAARPVLSPDGSRVAWAPADVAAADIFVANADGSARTNLTRSDADDEEPPLWSPEGGRLAFLVRGDGEKPITALRVIGAVTGASLGMLPSPPEGFSSLAWLPDGTGFAFLAPGAGGSLDLYTLSLDGSLVQTTTTPGAEVEAAWSPDTHWIAVVRAPVTTPTPSPGETLVPETPAAEPTAIETPTGEPSPPTGSLTPEPTSSPPPTFTNDELWLLNVAGSEHHLSTPGLSSFQQLRWSPNGQYLSFLAKSAFGGEGLYIVDMSTGSAPDLVFARSRVDEWTWAPDSNALAVVANGGACGRTCPRGFLHLLDFQTGALRTLPDIRVLSPIAWPRE